MTHVYGRYEWIVILILLVGSGIAISTPMLSDRSMDVILLSTLVMAFVFMFAGGKDE
jgi:hypothetical protein